MSETLRKLVALSRSPADGDNALLQRVELSANRCEQSIIAERQRAAELDVQVGRPVLTHANWQAGRIRDVWFELCIVTVMPITRRPLTLSHTGTIWLIVLLVLVLIMWALAVLPIKFIPYSP
jgi:hypothetical protein